MTERLDSADNLNEGCTAEFNFRGVDEFIDSEGRTVGFVAKGEIECETVGCLINNNSVEIKKEELVASEGESAVEIVEERLKLVAGVCLTDKCEIWRKEKSNNKILMPKENLPDGLN